MSTSMGLRIGSCASCARRAACSPRSYINRARRVHTATATATAGSGSSRTINNQRPILVLALESSADDSSCAIVSSSRQILGHCTISQHGLNAIYGGINPLQAQNAHSQNIPRAIERCLAQARLHGVGMDDVEAVAYTRGPGMRGCLGIGEMAAKGIASACGKRLVGVHHMIPPKCPFLILLVSGGHTQLVLAESQERFRILLDTSDSKIGDAFEKAARILRLPAHPSKSPGAILESYAAQSPLPPYDRAPHPALPIPLSSNAALHTRAFSFAGLVSALERAAQSVSLGREAVLVIERVDVSEKVGVQTEKEVNEDTNAEAHQRELSRVFQEAAVSHLILKLTQAISSLDPDLKTKLGGLVVSGGVASNLFLRARLERIVSSLRLGSQSSALAPTPATRGDTERRVALYYPPIELCTDNAAMIAWVAILRLQSGLQSDPYDLPLRPKWSLEALYDDVP